ncbi:MAG TPA: cytochrome C oxidase subunit IV family protein [Terriglobales bacterium]|nr:cytochrome C oxidase subunit IV family protein [Terriglobales bacterium]
MTTAGEHKSGGMGQDLVVYLCILALAAIQFVIAYQNINGDQMFVRMLIVALVEAGLALLFFMHLWSEKRAFMWASGIITVFVLFALQYGWTDSFRISHGVPWAK